MVKLLRQSVRNVAHIGTIKYENGYKHVYASVADARTLVARHIDWYNAERPHSSLEDQTPNEA